MPITKIIHTPKLDFLITGKVDQIYKRKADNYLWMQFIHRKTGTLVSEYRTSRRYKAGE